MVKELLKYMLIRSNIAELVTYAVFMNNTIVISFLIKCGLHSWILLVEFINHTLVLKSSIH